MKRHDDEDEPFFDIDLSKGSDELKDMSNAPFQIAKLIWSASVIAVPFIIGCLKFVHETHNRKR